MAVPFSTFVQGCQLSQQSLKETQKLLTRLYIAYSLTLTTLNCSSSLPISIAISRLTLNDSVSSCNRVILRYFINTLCFFICLDHTTDDRGKLSLDTQESLQKSSRSFNASSLVRRICLQVMSIGGIKTQAIVVVISFHPHFFAQFYCILIAKIRELSSPLQHNHYLFDWSFGLSFWCLTSIHNF